MLAAAEASIAQTLVSRACCITCWGHWQRVLFYCVAHALKAWLPDAARSWRHICRCPPAFLPACPPSHLPACPPQDLFDAGGGTDELRVLGLMAAAAPLKREVSAGGAACGGSMLLTPLHSTLDSAAQGMLVWPRHGPHTQRSCHAPCSAAAAALPPLLTSSRSQITDWPPFPAAGAAHRRPAGAPGAPLGLVQPGGPRLLFWIRCAGAARSR